MLDKTDTRCRNFNWTIKASGEQASFAGAQLAVLMDIREQLQLIRARLDCPAALAMPRYLEEIKRNTKPKPKRKRRAV